MGVRASACGGAGLGLGLGLGSAALALRFGFELGLRLGLGLAIGLGRYLLARLYALGQLTALAAVRLPRLVGRCQLEQLQRASHKTWLGVRVG